MNIEENKGEKRIHFSIEGLEGFAEEGQHFWGFHGIFASHTGYRSIQLKTGDIEEVKRTASDLYNSHVGLCYLVGDEYREQGWKTIFLDYDGKIRIRLPCWADVVIKKALVQIGMIETCEVNRYWSFKKFVDLVDAKEALKPLLEKNTRFKCEKELAEKLLKNFAYSSLNIDEKQMSLF